MDQWSYQVVYLINQYPDITENLTIKRYKTRYERILRHEESLHLSTHLLKALVSKKSYTLGQLAALISGQKNGSVFQSTQIRLKRKLEVFKIYQLVTNEEIIYSKHSKRYKITPTKRLGAVFSQLAK